MVSDALDTFLIFRASMSEMGFLSDFMTLEFFGVAPFLYTYNIE